MPLRKLTFQEAWDSSTIFFVDEELEAEIDAGVAMLLQLSESLQWASSTTRTTEDMAAFLHADPGGLDVLLRDIGLSDEKFMRIISLLRKIGRVAGPFDTEWKISQIKRNVKRDDTFAELVARLLMEGKHDPELWPYIPRYYLDKLNYREIGVIPQALRELRYKEATIGTYGARKGHKV